MDKEKKKERVVGDVISWIGNVKDHIEIVNSMCELNINSDVQGYAIVDGIKGVLQYPMKLLGDAERDLKEIYPGSA